MSIDCEKELSRVKAENKMLRDLLGINKSEKIEVEKFHFAITNKSSANDKIKLFRNLFKGQNGVYAIRWENKQGKSGYSPLCKNRWNKAKCNLPKIHCRECRNKDYETLSDNVLYDHLTGKKVVGIYPLLQNDCCNFLAIDFDKHDWKKDVNAFYQTCKKMDVPSSIEISRSGNGAHIWIFFTEEITAKIARKLGSVLISETMKMGNILGIDSYDRMFPNQDYLPAGGFGNLIALPLQKKVRELDYSVFVDHKFNVYPDQWAYLSFTNKISPREVNSIITNFANNQIPLIEVTKQNRIISKQKVKITISNQIYISKLGLPYILQYKFIKLAIFSNPEFYIAQSSRRSTYNIPRFIDCGVNFPKKISIPTGLLNEVLDLLHEANITFIFDDRRNSGKQLFTKFNGVIHEKQKNAFSAIMKSDMGVLCANTGFGKTILAINMIAERKVNTLILVHRTEILDQWREKLNIFLEDTEIGVIGSSKFKQTLNIDVAMIQTLKNQPRNVIDNYGQIIIDECHHIAAYTFEKILKKSSAKYILGLTATPHRKDGHHPIVFMQCGNIIFKTSAKSTEMKKILNIRNTSIEMAVEELTLPKIISELYQDKERNQLIFEDVIEALRRKRNSLILTERIDHLYILEKLFEEHCKNIIVLKGGMGKKQKEKMKTKLIEPREGEQRLIIASGKYIGEGFDYPVLDTLFLSLPISWKGTLQQYVGRIMRDYKMKDSIEVFDYVDVKIDRLLKMFNKRKRAYKSLGFKVFEQREIL